MNDAGLFNVKLRSTGQQINKFVAIGVHFPIRPIALKKILADKPSASCSCDALFQATPECITAWNRYSGTIRIQKHVGVLRIERHVHPRRKS